MRVPSSLRDPKRNAIVERTHLALLNMLRSLELSDVMWEDEERVWDICLAKEHWVM